MAKKRPSSSSRKSGNAKTTKSKGRAALDNSTSEAALEAAIERQRQAIEEGEIELPPDPNEPVETLLNVPNRKPLEDPGTEEFNCNHGLVRFVIDKPHLYKKFIAQLLDGATLASAIFSSKFCNPPRVKKWLAQGMQDAEEDKDTYFSRLYYDVAGANAEKRAQVEILVAEEDPKFWLQHGPGKYLDDEWKPKLSLRGPSNAEPEKLEGEGVLKIESKPDTLEGEELEGEVLGKAPANESQYEAALKAMRDAGVHPEQQPEGWVKSFRIQSGEQLSDEELEVKEEENSPISLGSNEALLTEQQRQAQSSMPS